jgi:thioredoxin-related protein
MTIKTMTRVAWVTGTAALLLLAASAPLAQTSARSAADHLPWLTDLPAAEAQAKAQKKLVMLDFTGSDWCVVCAQARKEIFSKKDFADYAAQNLVLVEVDFPQRKPQSEALAKANRALADKYKVDGFPTFIVLDGDGKELGRFDYEPGGPKPFITRLEKLKR